MFGWLKKLEYLVLCFLINLKVLAFSGLNERSNSSLATEKSWLLEANSFNSWHVNLWNPIDHVFYKILERELSMASLGELINSSLAIERPRFRQLNEVLQEYINHWNLIKYAFE